MCQSLSTKVTQFRDRFKYNKMKISSLILMSVVLICIAQSKVTRASSNSSVQTNQSHESAIKQQQKPSREFVLKQHKKNIRSVENWIALTCLALTIIVSLVLLIIFIHLRSRQKSNLLHLYA